MAAEDAPVSGKSVGTVSIAILVATGLGAAITLAFPRLLPATEVETFLAFWGLLMGLGSALNPLEQEVSRLSALARGEGRPTSGAALQTAAVAGGLIILVSVLVLLPPVTNRLVGGHGELVLIAVVGGLAFTAQYCVRGLLVGQDRIRLYGGIIVTEALIRLVLIGVVVLAGLTGMVWLAVAVALGSFAWLAFAVTSARLVDWRGGWQPWRAVAGRIVILMISAGLTACVITGYPVLVKLLASSGESTAVGALFSALTLARLPLLLFSPVQAMAVPAVVRLSHSEDGRRQLRALLVKIVLGALGLALVGAALGGLIGPWILSVIYPNLAPVAGWAVAGLVWSSVLMAAVLLFAAVMVANTRVDHVLITWGVVVAVSALLLLFAPGDTVFRAVLGLAVAPTAGLGVAVALVLRRR
ncbi:hypothetical protein GCM10010174_31210 [Kutzneria viridogrisea]